jgi:hypothetical protein
LLQLKKRPKICTVGEEHHHIRFEVKCLNEAHKVLCMVHLPEATERVVGLFYGSSNVRRDFLLNELKLSDSLSTTKNVRKSTYLTEEVLLIVLIA